MAFHLSLGLINFGDRSVRLAYDEPKTGRKPAFTKQRRSILQGIPTPSENWAHRRRMYTLHLICKLDDDDDDDDNHDENNNNI